MLLKAAKPKYKYKSEKAWLDAVYRKNKAVIDSTFANVREKNKKKAFKAILNERIEKRGETLYQAVRRIGRTEFFSSRKERAQENILSAIKKDKETFRVFRLSVGWKEKIDTSKFVWDYEDKVYRYGNTVIDVRTSPYEVIIMSSKDWEFRKDYLEKEELF